MGDPILVVKTGGTISAVPTAQGLSPWGNGSGLELVEDESGLTFESLFSYASSAMGLDEIGQLHSRIRSAASEQYAAVVVTHGTDTLAETAFVLSLVDPSPRIPVILTGAMRAPSQPGSDAARNLRDALAVARSPSCPAEVLVVFDAKVFAGWCVDKVSGTSYDAFASTLIGPLGYVAEGEVQMHANAPAPTLGLPLDCASSGNVATVVATPGDSGEVLALVGRVFDGVAIEGLGAGHVSPQMMSPLQGLASKKPVLVTTGWPGGMGLKRTYSGPGSEMALAAAGVIGGWSLGPRKAALAMALLLGQTSDVATIRQLLANNLKGPA